jgi:hypothetical protein
MSNFLLYLPWMGRRLWRYFRLRELSTVREANPPNPPPKFMFTAPLISSPLIPISTQRSMRPSLVTPVDNVSFFDAENTDMLWGRFQDACQCQSNGWMKDWHGGVLVLTKAPVIANKGAYWTLKSYTESGLKNDREVFLFKSFSVFDRKARLSPYSTRTANVNRFGLLEPIDLASHSQILAPGISEIGNAVKDLISSRFSWNTSFHRLPSWRHGDSQKPTGKQNVGNNQVRDSLGKATSC